MFILAIEPWTLPQLLFFVNNVEIYSVTEQIKLGDVSKNNSLIYVIDAVFLQCPICVIQQNTDAM